ncbi:hypothetical protein L195_g062419 [Trifolium pratense]|uniref:Uncharacterized protein n=1 Tax=Trifolium pratense TaxID=57577 RepID=A0A2K3KFJ7_TRIPR|nr:hypothetical protein L195_g062419 [Trifolium pratense]
MGRKFLCLRQKFQQKGSSATVLPPGAKILQPGAKLLVPEVKFSFIDPGYKRKRQI